MTHTSVYVDKAGNWLLVAAPDDYDAPLCIEDAWAVGSPTDCLQLVYDWLRATTPYVFVNQNRCAPVQKTMAKEMGVSKTAISQWLRQRCEIRIDRLDPQASRWLALQVLNALAWDKAGRIDTRSIVG